jgi:superkiller protein 3
MLGIVRGRQQRYPEAEALFRRVLQLDPKSVVASRNLAGALLAQDKPDDAIKQYNQAIQLSPQDLELKIELAKLDLARGNFAEALSTLEGIKPDRFPSSAAPLKAASLLGLGRRSEAESMISRVKGSSADALDLAQVFVEANAADAALKTLSLVSPVPKRAAAQFYYVKGRALRQKGDSAAAVASFRQALASDPKAARTLIAMAEIFAGEKKYAESLHLLEKAKDLNPDSKEILRHLIVEAMRSGQNDKALLASQDLQRKSSDPDDRFLIASVMVQQKQFLPATHLLEEYVSERPQDARAYLGLGIAYLSLLRYADARQALERSIQLKPDIAEAEYHLGVLFGQQGNREEAIQHWQRAVELQPHHAQALFSLGTIYLESGKLPEAESAFSRSLATDPHNMKTEYNLALVLNKLGKSEEAKQHFERYRRMQEAEHTTSGNPPAESKHP